MARWLLDSIEIAGGFLPELSLQFPRKPGLTCIIGPRGSGKSTLIEAIRYCLSGGVGGNKSRQDLIQANLATSVITMRTAPDTSGASYVISRRPRNPPSIATSDGRSLSNVDLERGTFLPIDAFSSLEIENIADESLGDKRRLLLDELQGDEYRTFLHALNNHRRALESNADAIRNARKRLHDLTERIEELGDARANLASMPTASPGDDTIKLTLSSQQEQLNIKERKMLASTTQQHAEFSSELSRVSGEFFVAFSKLRAFPDSANVPLLEEAIRIINDGIEATRQSITEACSRLKITERMLLELTARLSTAHANQHSTFVVLQARNAEVSRHIQDRMAAEQAVTALTDFETARDEAKALLTRLFEERAKLKGNYLLEREKISSARRDIAANLEREAGRRVRVRVLRNADNLAYRQLLLEGLKGARVRNHDDILTALLRIRPEELAELIDENALTDFEAQTVLGEERSRKVLDAFRTNLDPFSLEVVNVEDRIGIELNVGTDQEPNFKDASELSRGQKCTALLPLLLARRDTPLIIDQPEDNLDNHFIYETVVDTLRRLRGRRQMIFVTHNANIPVLGDADLVIVMDSDGRRGFISKSGSVDACRSDIVDLLEGGPEAFELRRRRYERS